METNLSTVSQRAKHGNNDDGASIAGTEQFGLHAPSILSVQSLLDLKTKHGVPNEIELVHPDPSLSPELVKPRYYCAFAPYFVSCGLTFPLPAFLFEVLDHLRLTFSQMYPNFVQHVIALSVRAREEGSS